MVACCTALPAARSWFENRPSTGQYSGHTASEEGQLLRDLFALLDYLLFVIAIATPLVANVAVAAVVHRLFAPRRTRPLALRLTAVLLSGPLGMWLAGQEAYLLVVSLGLMLEQGQMML